MVIDNQRHPRADAVRNSDRILRAARAVFAETGPNASIEDVATYAGVSDRTLYRHFATKAELARAALDQCIAEQLEPAIEAALGNDDPREGFVSLIETAMTLTASEHNTLAAARTAGSPTADLSTDFFDALARLLGRAQDAGLIRPDLVTDDLDRIMAMLFSTLWKVDADSDGWRRYLTLITDGLSPAAATPLPPATTRPNAATPPASDQPIRPPGT